MDGVGARGRGRSIPLLLSAPVVPGVGEQESRPPEGGISTSWKAAGLIFRRKARRERPTGSPKDPHRGGDAGL